MEAWYVAKTKPAKERYVETCFTRKWGVEVFLPLIRRPAGRKEGWEPLFPTYLMCLVDPQSADWPNIRWTSGLCYFLGAGQELVPVSNELVTHLRQRVALWNEGGYVPRFVHGEHVVVTNGPFSGLDAIFQRYIPARQRCKVLLQLVGRLTKAELPVEVLRATSCYRALALETVGSQGSGQLAV